jgi:hypothetical protein
MMVVPNIGSGQFAEPSSELAAWPVAGQNLVTFVAEFNKVVRRMCSWGAAYPVRLFLNVGR